MFPKLKSCLAGVLLLLLTAVNNSLAQNAASQPVVPTHAPAVAESVLPVITDSASPPLDYPAQQLQTPELNTPARGTSQFSPSAGPVAPATGASAGIPLAGTSQLGGAAPAASAVPGGGILKWGALNLHPHFVYSVSYGNSLQAGLGERANTWIHQFSPGLLMNLGEHWNLDYTPTLRWYSDDQFGDGVDHSVSLNGRTTYRDWNFGLSQGFSISSQPLVETGVQTDQQAWSTSLTAGRALNSKLSLDLGLAQNLRYTGGGSTPNAISEQLTDTRSWSTMDWINYHYIDPLAFSLGAGFTYDDVGVGSDLTSEQIQARVIWKPGIKLNLTASGGVDIRQFLDSGSDMVSPMFSLSAGYQLFRYTSLTLSANRGVSPSYFQDAVTETTGINAGISQRLLGRFFLSVSGGYGMTSYTGTTGDKAVLPSNVDDYSSYSFSASLGTAFLKRGNVSVFYNKTFNNSDSALYNFNPQTVGAQVSYRF